MYSVLSLTHPVQGTWSIAAVWRLQYWRAKSNTGREKLREHVVTAWLWANCMQGGGGEQFSYSSQTVINNATPSTAAAGCNSQPTTLCCCNSLYHSLLVPSRPTTTSISSSSSSSTNIKAHTLCIAKTKWRTCSLELPPGRPMVVHVDRK